MSNPEGDEMGKKLSAGEAAKKLDCSRWSVARAYEKAVIAGRLQPLQTPGGHIRIDENQLSKLKIRKP